MKAVVLCAGKGTRIREVTEDKIPKPMIEVDGKPILEYTIENLEENGVDEVLINLHHKGEVIEEYFGSSYGDLDIKYFWEDELRGTAGALSQMKDDLNDSFLTLYGDIITDLDFNEFMSSHNSNEGIGTILTYSGEENLTEASIIDLVESRINDFIEKPSEDQIQDVKGEIWTNASVYCFDEEIFEFIDDEGEQDFGHDIFPQVVDSEYFLSGYRLPKKTYWREIGRPGDYKKLEEDVLNSRLDWN